jgi:hypothetical protein
LISPKEALRILSLPALVKALRKILRLYLSVLEIVLLLDALIDLLTMNCDFLGRIDTYADLISFDA